MSPHPQRDLLGHLRSSIRSISNERLVVVFEAVAVELWRLKGTCLSRIAVTHPTYTTCCCLNVDAACAIKVCNGMHATLVIPIDCL